MEEYWKLREEWIAAHPAKRGDGKAFERWARAQEEDETLTKIISDRKHWSNLQAGVPVPQKIMLRYAEHVAFRMDKIVTASEIGEPAEKPMNEQIPNVKTCGYPTLMRFYSSAFIIHDEAYCQTDKDIELAATSILGAVGERKEGAIYDSAAVARGSRIMHRTVDGFAELLNRFRVADERTVLFAVWGKRNVRHRVGVSVIIPTTEEFFKRLRAGKAEDLDITTSDIQAPSKFLLIEALAEFRDPNSELDYRRDKASRAMAQSKSLNWQMASLCASALKFNPRLIAPAGNEENEKILRSFGFADVGSKMPVTGKSVWELVPPPFPYLPVHLAQYVGMKSLMILFQAAISSHEFLEESDS